MGESRPSRATASDCQLLTEQPGKDLQTMGNVSVGVLALSRLCIFAGHIGEVPGYGDLASVCSRSGGSRRAHGCGKSPKDLAFAVPMCARGMPTKPR